MLIWISHWSQNPRARGCCQTANSVSRFQHRSKSGVPKSWSAG